MCRLYFGGLGRTLYDIQLSIESLMKPDIYLILYD